MNTHPVFHDEAIVVSSGSVLYICLIRTSDRYDPFISAIELRMLKDGMYRWAKPGTMMRLKLRCDVGGNSLVRYPQDVFDRFWEPNNVAVREKYINEGYPVVNLSESISTNQTPDLPPSIVMQTALVTDAYSNTIELTLENRKTLAQESLLLLYIADILPVHRTETISFDLLINGQKSSNSMTILQNYSAIEVPISPSNTRTRYSMELQQAPHSTLPPIINAFEYFLIVDTDQLTYPQDIKALDAIKSRFDIKEWISDPCHVIDWNGISCDKSGSSIRISEINLSGRNLTGLIPQNIAQLTALINVSLENNQLTGPFPHLSNLTMLERLHLQNNNLTGNIPDWLSELKNLTELFIDNNSFSGVIPAQLLHRPSLNLTFSGNPHLRISSKPNQDKQRLILGITISGSVVIVLWLIVIIAVDRKKSKKKKTSSLEKESNHAVDQGNSMVIVPNTTKSRAFTLQEITVATQNFSHKIGQGGFGSVFFGRLEQGEDIAVKVLSVVSKQGVEEFLNEVDLFSRVHHKNLVPLLGYCIESRELMLVYEHMSGGSLMDRLYGPIAEHSQLNWKTRLKIASDAAQGLEYLHIGCTPKIIHRDIKTANILLDRNFNGKLADFGLSRMTIDGEASYIITSVKGTFGYLDPEYFSTHLLTEKSDVYSFGVVLLEIICGRRPINVKLPGEQLNLIRWVTPYVEMDENAAKMEEIIDKRLGRNYDMNSIIGVAKLAIRCVQAEPSCRPSIDEVVAKLKEAIKLEKDKDSLISEIDIEYEDLGASSACYSVGSSGPKEMDSVESSSKISKQG